MLMPGGLVDGADGGEWSGFRGFGLAGGQVGVDGGEGGEVVGADDVAGGLLEDGEVEGEMAVPDVGGEHGGADGGREFGRGVEGAVGEDAVFVGFAAGGVAGVEVFGSVLEGEDADGGWEGAVEGKMEVGGGDGGVEREGGDLGQGVDAGVGASGALGEDGFSGDVVDGLGEGSLDGGESGLDLPAVEGSAVVGEDGFPERHGMFWTVSRQPLTFVIAIL